MMLPSVSWVILTRDLPWPLETLMGATMVAVLSYIWSRPSRPGRSGTRGDSKPAPTQRGPNPPAAGIEDGEQSPSRAP